MKVFIKGRLNKKFFQERVIEVLYKIKGEERIDFTLIVIENMKQCKEASEELVREERDEFLKECNKLVVSSSFRIGGKEYIVIKANRRFLKKNKSALRGLIAHELMHTILRVKGIEKKINDNAKNYVGRLAWELTELGFDEKSAISFSVEIYRDGVLCLKDLLANNELLNQSFFDDLMEYYYNILELKKGSPFKWPHYEKIDLKSLKELLKFELYLMPSWLPFVICDKDKCVALEKRIREKYESNFRHISDHMHEIQEVYERFRNNRDEFIKQFFQALNRSVVKIVEELLT